MGSKLCEHQGSSPLNSYFKTHKEERERGNYKKKKNRGCEWEKGRGRGEGEKKGKGKVWEKERNKKWVKQNDKIGRRGKNEYRLKKK